MAVRLRGLLLLGLVFLAAFGGGRATQAQVSSFSVSLTPGFNLVAYGGPTQPVEEALNDARDAVSAVWLFDPAGQAWLAWNPALPASLRGFDQLETGRIYFVQAREPAAWTFLTPVVDLPVGESVTLAAGGTPLVYGGSYGFVADAVADIADRLVAVFSFDAASQAWVAWRPSLPEALQGFNRLVFGQTYWFVTSEALDWTFPHLPLSAELADELVIQQVVDAAPAANLRHDLLVFRYPEVLQPGAALRPGFEDGSGAGGLVVEEPSYFYWIDDLPLALFSHPTRFVLVDQRTGQIQVSLEQWWPRLNGVDLFTDDAAYRDPANWVFSRLEIIGPPPAIAAAQRPVTGTAELRTAQQTPQVQGNECGLVVNGWSTGQPGEADLAAGAALVEDFMHRYGFRVVQVVGPPNNSPADYAQALAAVAADYRCGQMTVHVLAQGSPDLLLLGGEPLSAPELVAPIGQTELLYRFVIDASHSGSFEDDLLAATNRSRVRAVEVFALSTGEAGWSFLDVDPVGGGTDLEGNPLRPDPNPEDVGPEFTSLWVGALTDAMENHYGEIAARARVAQAGVTLCIPYCHVDSLFDAFVAALMTWGRIAVEANLDLTWGQILDLSLWIAAFVCLTDREQCTPEEPEYICSGAPSYSCFPNPSYRGHYHPVFYSG